MLRVDKGKRMRNKLRTVLSLVFLVILSAGLTLKLGGFSPTQKATLEAYIPTGRSALVRQNEGSKFNVTLWITDWDGTIPFGNLNVTVYDLSGEQIVSELSDELGYVSLKMDPGSYIVLVMTGNRTVGYQAINVSRSGVFNIRTWAYDLNLTLTDEYDRPLKGHVVFLFDQIAPQAPGEYLVITERVGRLVGKAGTDMNGTVRFFGVWNGTYRIRVTDGESVGDYVLSIHGPTSTTLKCIKVDLTLSLISGSGSPVGNATVQVRGGMGHLLLEGKTDEDGRVEYKNLYALEDVYYVSAQYGPRLITHEPINITEGWDFTITCWSYNLTVKCVDQEGDPLPNHFVFLHDQLIFFTPTNFTVNNETGPLVNWTRTDEDGLAFFEDLWNGTYRVRVMGGELIGVVDVNLQESTTLVVKCNKTYLVLRFITELGEPLRNVTISMYNSGGHLTFRGSPDPDGYIKLDGVYLDNYTVVAEMFEREVWSGIINVYKSRVWEIRCPVFTLTLQFVDPFGNPLPRARVILSKRMTYGAHLSFTLELKTDDNGYISYSLPSGVYEISCSYGIYYGSIVVTLDSEYFSVIKCNPHMSFWLMVAFVSFPLVIFTLILERQKLKKPFKIRKYRNVLLKLESMYENGLVDYQLYRKLREEYEAKLMELGGREVR